MLITTWIFQGPEIVYILKLCAYDNCPKISYTNFTDKIVYGNSADQNQTAPLAYLHVKQHSDQGLHCLVYHQMFSEPTKNRNNFVDVYVTPVY